MKIKSLFILTVLAFIAVGQVNGQDCGFYNLSKGTKLGYQNLDAKGKATGTSQLSCLDVIKSGSSVVYKIHSTFLDEKNKETMVQDYDMRCDDGNFYIDMKNMLNPATMAGVKDMEVNINSEDMYYPKNLQVGAVLPDASITVTAASNGVALMNISISVTNRKVVGTESVTVPAGTFECLKITYNVETKMLFKINATVSEYLNKGVGNVKSESFDKKGKLVGSTVLTLFEK